MDHVKNVNAFADQLVCLELPMRDEDIVMTLLKNFLAWYKYLITAMETISMNKLTMDYVTVHLMHEMSKREKNEP